VAADFCLPMIALARAKYSRAGRPAPSGLAADALRLPFPAASFAAATVSFGLRNVPALDSALGEIHRVLVPGGSLVVLEFAMPTLPVLSGLYRFYFRSVLPRIGRRLSDSASAYDYLPDSVPAFPQRDAFLDRLRDSGFVDGAFEDLSGGIVCLYTARRA
jgi:demethylmenaquinone methyltransferase/2-methoxy-6-polyprenyl-1,4-benzoquinol methylase